MSGREAGEEGSGKGFGSVNQHLLGACIAILTVQYKQFIAVCPMAEILIMLREVSGCH